MIKYTLLDDPPSYKRSDNCGRLLRNMGCCCRVLNIIYYRSLRDDAWLQHQFGACDRVGSRIVSSWTGCMIHDPCTSLENVLSKAGISMIVFMIIFIACGIGFSLAEVLVVRFFAEVAGSAMVAISPEQ